jgi:hypothetical protein
LGVGVFWGCKKEDGLQNNSNAESSILREDKQLIEEAKIYFEGQLDLLRKQKEVNKNKLKVRDNQTTDATFDGLDVNPKWDNAKVIRQNGSSFVETPYELEGGKQFGLSISKNAIIAPDEKSASRLIVKKNRSGVQSASFMAVSADDEYLNGNNTSLKDFTYQSVPKKFKGNEMHFNIDGSFRNGWHFAGGKLDGTIKKRAEGSLSVRGDCYQEFCQYAQRWDWGTQDQNGVYVVNSNRNTCNWQLRLLYCEGWEQDPWNNNSNNNNNNNGRGVIYGEDTGSWAGGNPAIMATDYLGMTKPCYKGVLQRLLNGDVESDLNIYLQSFTSKTFTLIVHDDTDDFPSTLNTAYSTFDAQRGVADIYLNNKALENASVEFIASTMIHEILHVYLTAVLYDNTTSNEQHYRMAEEYAECLENILRTYYPNLDNNSVVALTWKGLWRTLPYIDKSKEEKDRITELRDKHQNLNNKYGGAYGNPCH